VTHGSCADGFAPIHLPMSYGELQPVHVHDFETPDAPWRRADTCDEIERAASVLARELSDLLGWKVKVEVTARLGGQIASSAMRAVPRERD
jgi:hypothetical protein